MRRAQKHKKSIPSRPHAKIKQAGAWFKPPHRDAVKPAPKAEPDMPRKMAKVLRQIDAGRTLHALENLGVCWLTFGKVITKVKQSVFRWLRDKGYILHNVFAGCWVLTGAGKQALTA